MLRISRPTPFLHIAQPRRPVLRNRGSYSAHAGRLPGGLLLSVASERATIHDRVSIASTKSMPGNFLLSPELGRCGCVPDWLILSDGAAICARPVHAGILLPVDHVGCSHPSLYARLLLLGRLVDSHTVHLPQGSNQLLCWFVLFGLRPQTSSPHTGFLLSRGQLGADQLHRRCVLRDRGAWRPHWLVHCGLLLPLGFVIAHAIHVRGGPVLPGVLVHLHHLPGWLVLRHCRHELLLGVHARQVLQCGGHFGRVGRVPGGILLPVWLVVALVHARGHLLPARLHQRAASAVHRLAVLHCGRLDLYAVHARLVLRHARSVGARRRVCARLLLPGGLHVGHAAQFGVHCRHLLCGCTRRAGGCSDWFVLSGDRDERIYAVPGRLVLRLHKAFSGFGPVRCGFVLPGWLILTHSNAVPDWQLLSTDGSLGAVAVHAVLPRGIDSRGILGRDGRLAH